MKVLVTGSNGFIGKHLVYSLRNDKKISLILSSRVNSEILPRNVDQFILDSIDSQTNWKDTLDGVDTVIHLAGLAHNKAFNTRSYSQYLRKINVEAVANLASQAVDAGVKKFIFLSSIKVNGEETLNNRPFKADDDPNPQDIYGKSKLEAETIIKEIVKDSSTEFVIIRPVLVYGPGVKGNFLSLIKWIKIGIPFPLGSVKNKRSFVSIKNLIDFIIVCLKHPSAANQIFLVCDKYSISSSMLIEKLSHLLKKKPFLIPFPKVILRILLTLLGKKEMFIKLSGSLEVNIQKNLDTLDWLPIQSTDEALEETVEYFLRN